MARMFTRGTKKMTIDCVCVCVPVFVTYRGPYKHRSQDHQSLWGPKHWSSYDKISDPLDELYVEQVKD